MTLRRLVALLAIAALLSSAGHASAADWGLSVQGSTDVPERELATEYGTFAISELKRADDGDTVTVEADAPSELYFVRLYDADGTHVSSKGHPGGPAEFDFSIDGYEPGTYAFVQTNDSSDPKHAEVYDVAPIVVRGYAVDLEAPAAVEAGEGLSATVTIEEVADAPDPSAITVVVGDDSRTVEATAERSGDAYEATVPVDSLGPGEYTAYATVKGGTSAAGGENILGVSDTRDVTVAAESTDAGDDGGDGGAGGDGSAGDGGTGGGGDGGDSTAGTPESTPADTATETETETAEPTDANATPATATEGGAVDGFEATTESESIADAGDDEGSTADADGESIDAGGESTETDSTAVDGGAAAQTNTPGGAETSTTAPVFGPLGIALLGLAAVAGAAALRRRG